MQIQVTFQRMEELTAALRIAPEAVTKHLQASLEIAARDIAEQAADNHRFISRTGNLERNIKTKVDRLNMTAEVGFRASAVPYGSYVHDGTKPHRIAPRSRKALRWAAGGDFVFARGVLHPGTKKDPFIYNAADKIDVNDIFNAGVDRAIKEVFST